MKTFDDLESNVRGYIRDFPVVFSKALGAELTDEDGNTYIDFFAGAGVMNYGHNNPVIKRAVIDYLEGDGIVHGLDMGTVAKRKFIETFNEVILQPRGLNYKFQFPGPTGTNAVESAIKLARKTTKRTEIVSFTNGFHGMTLGALALTGNASKRAGAGIPLSHATPMPYDGYLGGNIDSLAVFEAYLKDAGSGMDRPAAAIVETVQGEGGINVASAEWLRRLEELCRAHDVLLIVDDIQMGNGRTGSYFSFDEAGIKPDMVCLSKAIGGIGMPMALVLIRPDLDEWKPGEHNGTFRGNNLAFVAAVEALDYWRTDDMKNATLAKGKEVRSCLEALADKYPDAKFKVRGRGLVQGLDSEIEGLASDICHEAFKNGLIMETAGVESQVAKIMPPLTIDRETLANGLDIIEKSVAAVIERRLAGQSAA